MGTSVDTWHKRFIWIARCAPHLWFHTVWARKNGDRWEYRQTEEYEQLMRDMAEW